MSTIQKGNAVITTRDIEFDSGVVPQGTPAIVGAMHNAERTVIRYELDGVERLAYVPYDAIQRADIYWKKRAMKAEADIDEIVSIVEARRTGNLPSAEYKMKLTTKAIALAKERRGE